MSQYQSAFPAYEHQAAALAKSEGKEAFAYLLEMRLGKSKVTLDDFGRLELAGDAQDLLVIAPGGVYRTWEKAVKEHFSEDLLERVKLHTWRSGTMSNKRKLEVDLFMREKARPRVLLMNVEALSTVKSARSLAKAFLSQRSSYMAVDESTVIKNHASKRTRFINMDLAQWADVRRILSGLPTPKDPLDLYSQFEFLDQRILKQRSFYSFRNRYAIMQRVMINNREVPLIKGFRDVDELYELIEPHSSRVKLADCSDVPDKVYMTRDVTPTPEQEKIYDQLKRFFTAQICEDAHVSAQVVVAQIIRRHQVLCGFTVDEEGKHHDLPENRTKELISLLSDYGGKAVVWCSYDYNVRKVRAALEDAFGKGSTAAFWGGNRSEREDEERRFLNDANTRWLVATAAAGGRGRTWDVADLMVYYSSTADLEHRMQSEERGTNLNKAKPVTVVDLIAPGTIEEKFINLLRKKIDLATAVTNDGHKEWLI